MNKFIRKNQKKLLAVFGTFLMIVFIVQLAPNGFRGGSSDRYVGTLGGTKVPAGAITASVGEWQLLSQIAYVDPNDPQQPREFVTTILGDAAREIGRNAFTFYLLTQEAAQRGITVNEEELQSVLANNIAGVPAEDVGSDRLKQAVSDCIAVKHLLDRASNVVKITRPFRDLALAREYQLFSLNLLTFPASGYLDKVPAPTDENIRNQFDMFKDEQPGSYGSNRNPLGFGYKTPNRAKVQFIEIVADEVRHAAEKSKSKTDWGVEAYTQFKAHRDYFDSLPVPAPPSTQPSTRPATPQSLLPAPHKLDDVDKDFALHANVVLQKLYEQQAYHIEDEAQKKIVEALTTGFGAYRSAQSLLAATTSPSTQPSTQPAALPVVKGPAGQYITDAFLEDLAKSIQTQFGFLPRVVDGNGPWNTIDQLAAMQFIGDAVYVLPNGQEFPFPQYALFVGPLLDEATQRSPMALALWQPSSPLIDRLNNRYIFRVSAVDASHPPSLDDVRTKVVADFKLSTAYDLALKAAHASFDETQKLGLKAAADATGHSIITTDLFNPTDVNSDTNKTPSIPPLNLKPESARRLAGAAQSLVSAPLAADGKPVALAELYPDATAAVIELKSSQPIWPGHNPGPYEGQIIYDATTQLEKELQVSFCDYQSVAARVNFKSTNEGG